MAALLRVFALSSLCILVCSFASAPSTALAAAHHARDFNIRGHDTIAKRKRNTKSKRCKAKGLTPPTPDASPASSSSVKHTSTAKPKPKPTDNPAPISRPPSNKKVGIAWANPGNDDQIKYWAQPKVGRLYTWSPYCPPDAQNNGIECCPMLWGTKSVSQFQDLVKPGYAKCAMGPNEPNFSGQSNMSPDDAVSLWRQHMEPLKAHGYELISPACTNGQDGKDWMVQFMSKCTGCHIDAVALHYYGTNADDFISWVTDFHNTWGKKIWVTEVADQNFGGGGQASQSEVTAFLNKITGWMDSTDFVEQYFWFGVLHDMSGVNPDNQLMLSNGQPNDLGWNYLT